MILTGGDPLARADPFESIDEARSLGIAVSITPAATPVLTGEVLARLKDHGVEGLGLSLDVRRSAGDMSWKCRCRSTPWLARWSLFLDMTGEQIRKSGATRSYGIRDGHGIMFVSNTGDMCPAGFLPLSVGNVRRDHIVDMYRNSPLFRQLDDSSQFEDRCGVCDYRTLCGGSRARAFAAAGNPLASDPICLFDPR